MGFVHENRRVQFISKTKISHMSLDARFSVTDRDNSMPETLESLQVVDCSLGMLPLQSRRVIRQAILQRRRGPVPLP